MSDDGDAVRGLICSIFLEALGRLCVLGSVCSRMQCCQGLGDNLAYWKYNRENPVFCLLSSFFSINPSCAKRQVKIPFASEADQYNFIPKYSSRCFVLSLRPYNYCIRSILDCVVLCVCLIRFP